MLQRLFVRWLTDRCQDAAELSPNYVSAHHWYSNTLRHFGHYEAGLEQINEAIQLDPLSTVLQANLGTVLFELGRPEESLAQFKKVVAMDSTSKSSVPSQKKSLR